MESFSEPMCPFESKIISYPSDLEEVCFRFFANKAPFVQNKLKANTSSTCPLTRLMNSLIHSSAPRWRWILLLLIGSLLMCLVIIGAYFIQGVLKGLWSIIWSLNGDKNFKKQPHCLLMFFLQAMCGDGWKTRMLKVWEYFILNNYRFEKVYNISTNL